MTANDASVGSKVSHVSSTGSLPAGAEQALDGRFLLAQQYLAASAIASRLRWLALNRQSGVESDFHREGMFVGVIAESVTCALQGVFADESLCIPFSLEDSRADYVRTPNTYGSADTINAENKFYEIVNSAAALQLERFLGSIKQDVENQLGAFWRVSNVRAWLLKPGANRNANTWHTDGLSRYERKIMMYLNPPNRRNGTIEIETKNGRRIELESANPTFLLAETGFLLHRGVAPEDTSRLRPTIEISLVPALSSCTQLVAAGLNARFPVPDQVALTELLEFCLRAGLAEEELVPICRAALAENSSHREANLLLGYAQARRGAASDAAACFDRVLARDPTDERALYGRALVALPRQADLTRARFVLAPTLPRTVAYFINGAGKKSLKFARSAKAQLTPRTIEALKGAIKALAPVYNRVIPPQNLNIGGGPRFACPGWANFEAVPSDLNPHPVEFSRTSTLPAADGTFALIYSSHCLEHLDDATTGRILDESRRLMRPNGRLLLKIPDFDRALSAWRSGDPSFFADKYWGYHTLTPTWPRRGVEDTLDSRAAMLFCGFWNEAHGHYFAGQGDLNRMDAYHGPPVLAVETLRQWAYALSPHELARRLRVAVEVAESSFTFNHQNAWGRDELKQLLERHGFEVKSMDEQALKRQYWFVPGINGFGEVSIYCLAAPR